MTTNVQNLSFKALTTVHEILADALHRVDPQNEWNESSDRIQYIKLDYDFELGDREWIAELQFA